MDHRSLGQSAGLLAVLLVSLGVASERVGAVTLGFDDVDTSILATQRIDSLRYAPSGVHILAIRSSGALDSVAVVRDGTTGSGAVSPPNAAIVGGPPNEPLVVIRFMEPVTGIPVTTSAVSGVVGDRSGEVDTITMRAYGLDGALIGTSSFQSNFAGHFGTVAITVPGIHRVEFADNLGGGGANLDDFSFAPLDLSTPAWPRSWGNLKAGYR